MQGEKSEGLIRAEAKAETWKRIGFRLAERLGELEHELFELIKKHEKRDPRYTQR